MDARRPRPRVTYDGGDASTPTSSSARTASTASAATSSRDLTVYERTYPFSWLGILAEAPPSSQELIYCRSDRGFALHSMRSPTITRMYLQVPADENLDDWPDDRIWDELGTAFRHRRRVRADRGPAAGQEPHADAQLRRRRPCNTAGCCSPATPRTSSRPTGAKGMNLAIADVRLLSRALGGWYADGRDDLLAAYTDTALRRVWRATHFSWWMTTMLHPDPDDDPFAMRLAEAQLDYVTSSRAMATSLAENYTGLPYESDWSYR